jgi:hypothetical protein
MPRHSVSCYSVLLSFSKLGSKLGSNPSPSLPAVLVDRGNETAGRYVVWADGKILTGFSLEFGKEKRSRCH